MGKKKTVTSVATGMWFQSRLTYTLVHFNARKHTHMQTYIVYTHTHKHAHAHTHSRTHARTHTLARTHSHTHTGEGLSLIHISEPTRQS